jgi:hypothetical protein
MLKDVLNYAIYKFNQVKEHNMIWKLVSNKIFKVKKKENKVQNQSGH